MLPEMFWKMKNLITRVEMTQLQNQSQVIPMERTHTLNSHLKYFCTWGRHPTRKLGMREPMREGSRGGGVDLNIISGWGKVTFNFRSVRGGVRLNFEPYFTHFPTSPPGNHCTVPDFRLSGPGSLISPTLSSCWCLWHCTADEKLWR